jgi:hypothetical protein
MEVILTKTVSQSDFETIYGSDYKTLHSELLDEFYVTYPDETMNSASGFSTINEDGSITYTLTVN